MTTYKLRFWYWHQEVTITGITADELVQSLFFPFPITVTIHSLDKLSIEHLKREDRESLDTAWGNHGRTELSDDFWILEEE